MSKLPSGRYVAATVVAAGLGIIGAWLPWVEKLPVASPEDTPRGAGAAYTIELIPELDTGFESFDLFVLVPLLFALLAGAAAASQGQSQWTDTVLSIVGTFILWIGGQSYMRYYTVDRYAAEPGIYLVLAAGLLLLLTGAGGFLTRFTPNRTKQALPE